ncbi:uncharacterized protein LOC109611976 [Musca domestica]|uniref:Uncharacterized protein LOC109611976 n=1 Tax=Musca domestica TaxID=7370 RepID=A0A9J7IDF0_MUSDO|nr:uncharacterized protein LOC109611976 [Musca domestica]
MANAKLEKREHKYHCNNEHLRGVEAEIQASQKDAFFREEETVLFSFHDGIFSDSSTPDNSNLTESIDNNIGMMSPGIAGITRELVKAVCGGMTKYLKTVFVRYFRPQRHEKNINHTLLKLLILLMFMMWLIPDADGFLHLRKNCKCVLKITGRCIRNELCE